jgi:hypothetical protein
MMDDSQADGQADAARAGLCGSCAHVTIVANDRGSRFYMCRLSLSDPRFRRYPPLPVLECPGYVRVPPRGA